MRQICATLILEQDEFTRNGLLDALAAKYGHKSLWKNAVNDARRIRNEEKARRSSQRSGIDLRKYGFFEEKNCYWSNEDGGEKQWSNFKMKPLFHIMGVDDSVRLYEITNIDGVTRTLELDAEELVSINKFMVKVESAGNFLWLANVEELKKLKRYLFDITGTAIRIRQYGWQKRGFSTSNSTITTCKAPATSMPRIPVIFLSNASLSCRRHTAASHCLISAG